MLIAPQFDPFGGRPTQIDIPSVATLKKMMGNLTRPELVRRGGLNVGIKQSDCYPQVKSDGSGVEIDTPAADCTSNQVCFHGIPIITIAAYIMLSVAFALLLPVLPLRFLFRLKFCIPLRS